MQHRLFWFTSILVVLLVTQPSYKTSSQATKTLLECRANTPIYTIQFSQDSQYLLAGWNKGTVGLWDIRNGSLISVFHDGTHLDIHNVTFSASGEYIASINAGGLGTIWELTSQKKLFSVHHYDETQNAMSGINDIFFVPNSNIILTVGYENIGWWDSQSGKKIRTVLNYDGISLSPDGTRLISYWSSAIIDTRTGKELKRIKGGLGQFSPNGQYIITEGPSNIYVWDASTYNLIREFEKQKFVAISSNDQFLLSFEERVVSGRNAGVYMNVWDVAIGRKLHSFYQSIPLWDVFLPDGDHLLYSVETLAITKKTFTEEDPMEYRHFRSKFQAWNISQNKADWDVIIDYGLQDKYTVSRDGTYLGIARYNGQIVTYELKTGRVRQYCG